jgi:hypothetical protein
VLKIACDEIIFCKLLYFIGGRRVGGLLKEYPSTKNLVGMKNKRTRTLQKTFIL